MINRHIIFLAIAIFTIPALAQTSDLSNISGGLDDEYLESLPEDVRNDLLAEIGKNNTKKDNTIKKRPSTELQKFETIRNWENFQREQLYKEQKSERYGINLFRTMQSSFMPINEPNFGSDYILDYGDYIQIRSFGRQDMQITEEIGRDGSITVEGIGKIFLAGINFDRAVEVLNQEFERVFIGSEIVVNLQEIRDIKILITGNASYPGMYTMSGNSNILQALNMAGGVSENGSLRNVALTRNGVTQNVDLYMALIFGDLNNVPTLRSGDSINIKPVNKLVRAGTGFINEAVYEMKDNETFEDLLNFSGGVLRSLESKDFSVTRFYRSGFNEFDLSFNDLGKSLVENLDTINLNHQEIGTIRITGSVNNPGTYNIVSGDRISDVIKRAGGYKNSAYVFGASLFREKAKKLEKQYANKAYENLIRFLASDPKLLTSQGASFLPLLLSEIKNIEPSGRVTTEFDLSKLDSNPQTDIFVNDKDIIHVPKYDQSVFIYGEVSNPGSIPYVDGKGVMHYIKNSGNASKYASNNYIYVVSPDGIAQRHAIKGIGRFIDTDINVYPGSVIYVPREIGKVQGVDFYATIAPVFSSLALSIASLNSINND